jgi:hypothetical protein
MITGRAVNAYRRGSGIGRPELISESNMKNAEMSRGHFLAQNLLMKQFLGVCCRSVSRN